MQLVKYLIIFSSVLFSLSVIAAEGVFDCNDQHLLQRHKDLHQSKKEKIDTVLWYSLAHTSLCLGKITEGMIHLRRASDLGHIVATHLLSIYHEKNHTLNPAEKTKNLENLSQAIFFATKAVQLIELAPHYPEGTTSDMPDIEHKLHTSFYIFTRLPMLHFGQYTFTLKQIMRHNKDVAYNATSDILNKINETAEACVNRPALSIWKEKSKTIYKVQQTICNSLLTFVEKTYPLDKQRIQIHKNCTDPVTKCTEQYHQITRKIIQQMNTLVIEMIGSNSQFSI